MDWQPPIDLVALSKGIYSQGAEEAMLDRIFELVPPHRRFCLEFGASDGLRNSNTARLLRDQGWSGVLLEGSDYRYGRLEEHYRDRTKVRLVKATVQPDNVERLFAEAEVPTDLDLLSIDIDGNDYWVWRAIQRYRPQVLVIEYNPYYEPPQRWVMTYNPEHAWDGTTYNPYYEPPQRWVMTYNPEHAWDGTTYYGASLESLYQLGKQKGYELISCDRNGNNAFFV
jgi:hypothetical protein